MRHAVHAADSEPPSTHPPTHSVDPYELRLDVAPHEGRNFVVLALYQILMRLGWIFKTESIVMPVVFDLISGGGVLGGMLRGLLPMLNRFGHSVPPLLVARRIKVMPRKRLSVLRSTLVMAAVFLALAALWRFTGEVTPSWMWLAFLAGYTIFFIATGINQLSLGTMQGKLIHATRRGRLLTVANSVGAMVAIVAAAALLPRWLSEHGGRFDMIFGFTGVCFVASALCILLTAEPADNYVEESRGMRHVFRSAWDTVRHDRHFRLLALVGMAFGSSLVLFPHYQALARSPRMGLALDNLMAWVVVQNAGTALFSLLTGPMADYRGNRLVLRWLLLVIALMPVAAIVFSRSGAIGATLYPSVFFLVGITPVGFKTLNNYALEISQAAEHPRYLSTLSLCIALPLLLSPALGLLLEAVGFEIVFLLIGGIVFGGWLLTFRLYEPRERLPPQRQDPAEVIPEPE